MRNAGFILAIDAYLIRKGISSLLKQIEGVRVEREFEDVEGLERYFSIHGSGFLIISGHLYEKASRLFVSHPGLVNRTLLLKERHRDAPGEEGEEGYPFIYTDEGKDEMIMKIRELLASHPDDNTVETVRLTRREETIVRLVCMGLTNRQIADRLYLSTHTVTTHRKNINNKLGIRSVSGLIVFAIVNNIITIEEVGTEPAQ